MLLPKCLLIIVQFHRWQRTSCIFCCRKLRILRKRRKLGGSICTYPLLITDTENYVTSPSAQLFSESSQQRIHFCFYFIVEQIMDVESPRQSQIKGGENQVASEVLTTQWKRSSGNRTFSGADAVTFGRPVTAIRLRRTFMGSHLRDQSLHLSFNPIATLGLETLPLFLSDCTSAVCINVTHNLQFIFRRLKSQGHEERVRREHLSPNHCFAYRVPSKSIWRYCVSQKTAVRCFRMLSARLMRLQINIKGFSLTFSLLLLPNDDVRTRIAAVVGWVIRALLPKGRNAFAREPKYVDYARSRILSRVCFSFRL